MWSTSINEFYKELEKDVNTLFDEDYLSGISAKKTKIEIIQEEELVSLLSFLYVLFYFNSEF